MGTTLTALQAGSVRLTFTALIEGYEYILTDGDTTAAVNAHSGSGHTGALGGLFVQLENEQSLNPWEPFPSGGRCSLTIVPTSSADTFGIDTHLRDTGDETILTTTLDRNDVVAFVKDTSSFASSGRIHVGTECIAYTGKLSDRFTGLTRGKFHPFTSTGGEHHRVGSIASSPKLEPLVTEHKRTWIGAWVTIYAHRNVAGVLDTVTQAQLVFTGRIDSISDDPQSGGTVIELRHVLDCIREHTIGRELWSGRLGAGAYLSTGEKFRMYDHNGTALKGATDLVVVASGASGANQMNAGFYTHEQLQTAINWWWQSESQAARLHGTYILSASEGDGAIRTKIHWRVPGSSTQTYFQLYMPNRVAVFLGFHYAGPGSNNIPSFGSRVVKEFGVGDEEASVWAQHPLRILVFANLPTTGNTAQIIEERGTFIDNVTDLPSAVKPPFGTLGTGWGMFIVDDRMLIAAKKNGTTLESIVPFPYAIAGVEPHQGFTSEFSVDATVDNISSVSIRQIVMLEMQFTRALKSFFYSTGTSGFAHTTWDRLGFGLGLGIPAQLLGADFDSACDHLPGAYAPIIVIIDKPTRFVDLFKGDLIIRCAFLRWINGRLDLCQWRTPLSGHASYALAESNKAAPTGNKDDHRTSARESSEWQRSVVRILYNRDITQLLSDDGFRSSLSLEDRVAIDDAGGEGRSVTVKCRNTYGQYSNTGAGVEALAPGFLAIWPLFSRPMRLFSRSIDSRFFEGVSIGDCVTVSDSFARDPDTGRRGLSARPAIIVKHWYNLGGRVAGSDKPAGVAGEVMLMLLDSNRVKKYGPAAQLDDTANTGGFTAGYNSATTTIRCYAHKYSESSEAVDASHFAATYGVRVIEIDPSDPTSPQQWNPTVSSVSGNDITLSSALTGFDTSKKYRIVFWDYDNSQEAQKASFSYQADDANGQIQQSAAPHQYAVGWPAPTFTANSASDPVELPPNIISEDGNSRDVAHDLALVRLLNNLDDYKMAIQSPYLTSGVSTHTSGSGWKLVMVRPIFLSEAGLSTSVRRELSVAPRFRSTTGASVSLRVTLSRRFPTGTSVIDVNRGTDYVETTFATSSTTFSVPSAASLNIGDVKPADGVCWLLIEIGLNCETSGLSRCSEGPRVYP